MSRSVAAERRDSLEAVKAVADAVINDLAETQAVVIIMHRGDAVLRSANLDVMELARLLYACADGAAEDIPPAKGLN